MAGKKTIYREARESDFQRIRKLLESCGLPSLDVDGRKQKMFIAESDGRLVAVGGIEKYGDVALVRSIAVAPEYRKNGMASNIYHLIEEYAHDSEVVALYLMTESAGGFFQKHGFKEQERKRVPGLIKQTDQYSRLCPSSATVMFKALSAWNDG